MKKLSLVMMLLLTVTLISGQQGKDRLMTVTTSSRPALSLYKQAMEYYNDVNLDKALETFRKALAQDKDFFMVNYQLAFHYLLNRDADGFEEYADPALNCKANLSDGEKLLKDALAEVKDGNKNVVDLGKKLVELYPADPNSYNNLISFQSLAGDTVNVVETIKKAISVSPDPAGFYNQLGYAYLTLKENDKAQEAFDKYIELDPKNPNVYDSKGDYYLYTKKFDKAYESYMKAYYMDHSFSHDKAELAKELYERTEGRKMDIISM